MSRTCVIHQPDFLPYLGFFHRLVSADVLVLLDTAQFVRNTSRSWTHRDKIKTSAGERWISLSCAKAPLSTAIQGIVLSTGYDAAAHHLPIWHENYRDARFFSEIYPFLEQLYSISATYLVDLTIPSIDMLLKLLAIDIEVVRASSLNPEGSSNEMLVDILEKVGCDRYLSGTGALAYFDPIPYHRSGIEVIWQSFQHPVYPQVHGQFIPGLSSVDLLLNCGIEKSREILRSTAT